ncbi:NitT/TauT family transport system substrate-binding protein [Pseudonocardia oroxyli]|uniref:NitT/TauT family transport system substrate-binding protein n=2 Tax=Pseudonocardia oroxyli TaxID=366584 RepID=A0A1G8D067_PSEOR|nr:NitT/TauT family transport system substrate-binding protein [Pseudonocardia oroxyli]
MRGTGDVVPAMALDGKASSDMIAPLGTGDLQVGASGATAAFYNAIDRGVGVRMVADKGRVIPGRSYESILVDKRLWDSGEIRSMADLRGRPVADYQESSTTSAFLNAGLEKVGLTIADVNRTYITGAQHPAALQNGSVVASVTPEPYGTAAIDQGIAVRLPESDDMYPNQQTSVLLYGERFISEDADAAQRFMVAYLRAARTYSDAVGPDGRLTGPAASQVVPILAQRTGATEDVLRRITVNGVDPDGAMNREGIERDIRFYAAGGWLTNPGVSLDDCIDLGFAQKASAELGPYSPPASR